MLGLVSLPNTALPPQRGKVRLIIGCAEARSASHAIDALYFRSAHPMALASPVGQSNAKPNTLAAQVQKVR